MSQLRFRAPCPAEAVALVRSLGLDKPQAAAAAAAGGAAALAAGDRGRAALDDARRRDDQPPLRRVQPLLRAGPRAVDDLHLRGLPERRRHARGGAGREVRPRRPQARPPARAAAARRRLRLGRHGPARRQGVRRQGARRDAVAAAGRVGQAEDRRGGPRRPRRGAPPRLPRRRRVGLRRRLLDRADRAHRGAQLPGVLLLPARPAAPGGPAAQPLHHPAAQPPPGDRAVPRPLRLPRRRADRVGQDHQRDPERRPRGACTRRTSACTTR